MARAWQTVATVTTPEGPLGLRQRGESEFLIMIGARVLMTSHDRRSEQALATLACRQLGERRAPRLLIGGLGMGFTLRAALDALPATAKVDVAELNPVVIEWCQGPLAGLTGNALGDDRCRVLCTDVAKLIADAPPKSYDAILLDLYEGPHAATQGKNDPFYGLRALLRSRAALRPGGLFGVWSEEADAPFEQRFAAAGLTVSRHRAGASRSHVVYLGQPSASVVGELGPRGTATR
jgi:spermidine synthase